MALVAVSIVGAENLPVEAYRHASAALAARHDVQKVGPLVQRDGSGELAVTLRTTIGPEKLESQLQQLTERQGLSFRLLAYGALIYRSTTLTVPSVARKNVDAALESLSQADPGFEIPNLGNVTAHLQGLLDRHHC